jgi:hypothetical protein
MMRLAVLSTAGAEHSGFDSEHGFDDRCATCCATGPQMDPSFVSSDWRPSHRSRSGDGFWSG